MNARRPASPRRLPNEGRLFAPLERQLWDDLLKHQPRRPSHFEPDRIILASGCVDTPERATFVNRIVSLYPDAHIERRLDRTHNKIPPAVSGPLGRHVAGKKTLVLGIHKSAVRQADERGNTCPNYWHFSPYGFCPYDCQYCYLAGTRSVYISPAIKIFVNLPEIWAEIDRTARRLAVPTAFYLGKLQDALALEPLTGFVSTLVPRFAKHPYARLTLLTKAAEADDLVGLEHGGRTILSWSLNPPDIHARFERSVPAPDDRIAAMKNCADAGYPVRVNLMPILPVPGWQNLYGAFLDRLLTSVRISRLTFGGICIYPDARTLMECKIGCDNPISDALETSTFRRDDRRQRFPPATRAEMYRFLADRVRMLSPDTELALCLETPDVMETAGLSSSRGKCNCVL